jgi:hypothetical protein
MGNFPMAQKLGCSLLALVVLVLAPKQSFGYSLLTHEEIVDILWKDDIEPILLKRFPGATTNDLRKAHAYAYGGCLMPDIGYYPLVNRFFTDLAHYVRSGDFIMNLISESADLDQYAFALGALAHYSSDNCGHPYINRATALSFPKLRAKYGEEVTYENDPKAHIRVEFGFDITQMAKNRYTSDRYKEFIGFGVSEPVLERAFYKTYNLKLDDVLDPLGLSIGTFRRSVSIVIPKMTQVALATKRADIVKDVPNFDQKKFLFYLSRSEYEREWGKEYRRPGLFARILAFILKAVPKVGPFRALDYKIPTTQTEELCIKSVNKTVENYRTLLRAAGAGQLRLPDMDCDTGRPTQAGEYVRCDQTYGRLLDELSKNGFASISPELRQNILGFYANRPVRPGTRKERKAWCKTLEQLEELRTTPAGSR